MHTKSKNMKNKLSNKNLLIWILTLYQDLKILFWDCSNLEVTFYYLFCFKDSTKPYFCFKFEHELN